MTGMTPERLADIRERVVEEGDNATFIAHARADVPVLLAEVERLRAGIEALADWWQRNPGDGGYEVACEDHAREALALLNPTEGEADG